MERGGDNAHRGAAVNPALEEGEASELNSLHQEGGREEAGEPDAAAVAAVSRPLAVTPPVDAHVARGVIARWRAFVAERKGLFLLRLLALPDLLEQEVLKWLEPVDRTMLAQVGRPWLAAVLASGLPRVPKGSTVRVKLKEFCTTVERLTWAKANGCPWGLSERSWWTNPCALAAGGGHLDTLQRARQHDCPWDAETCRWAAQGGYLEAGAYTRSLLSSTGALFM